MSVPFPLECTITLVSDTEVEEYWFHPGNSVSATLGEKGGAVCAPLLTYKVLEERRVEIIWPGGSCSTWDDIQVDGDRIRVRCRGQEKVFAIARPKDFGFGTQQQP